MVLPDSKPLLKSKTFWLQAAAVLVALFPGGREWVADNPGGALLILALLNLALRLATNGAVTIFPEREENGGTSGGMTPAIGICTAAALFGLALPSCAPDARWRVDFHGPGGRVGYDSETGATVDIAVTHPLPVRPTK